MNRTLLYRYMGTNGVLTTPIHLEDIYYVRLVRLVADEGKILTNGTRQMQVITIPENEESQWNEASLDTNN